MAPRSPTHAFDPTPAVEHNDFSPLNQSTTSEINAHSSDIHFRNVRFSETPSLPPNGHHSIVMTNVPLLPPVASASHLPRHSLEIQAPTPGVDIFLYMQQCRTTNRLLKEGHDSERKTWDIERTALKSRIVELEQKLNKSRDPKRRSSNDASISGLNSFRQDFLPYTARNSTARGRISSEPTIQTAQPVWKGPVSTPPVTRVFSHDDDIPHLPSISENEPLPVLTNEISPTLMEKVESVPVPIEQVDKTLDGITLKSTALTSSFNKVASPQFISPAQSPSPRPKHLVDKLLHLEAKGLLSPLDEKLKRYAGHTPMAFDGTVSTNSTSSERLTPRPEKPAEPAPTRRPLLRPSENSDSYFSFTSEGGGRRELVAQTIPDNAEVEENPIHETDEDPALTGPLMLDPGAKSEASSTFLGIVDAKLSEAAARRSRKDSLLSDGSQEQTANGRHQETSQRMNDDDAPRLKVKSSTNFGSAWGQDAPGCL